MSHAKDLWALKAPLSGRRLDWMLGLLLVGAVGAVFWPVLRAGFVEWDDRLNIIDNPHLGLGWENIRWMFSDTGYVRRYLPLGWLSYSVDRVLCGGSPASYHAGNLLLHALNTLLLYAILKAVLRWSIKAEEENPRSWQTAAAAGSLWWAVNPLRAEPVAWASARIYCVAALFFFLAVLAYLRQADLRLAPQRRRRAGRIAVLCFGLSLFTYPVALGGLVVFVALDFFPLRRLPLKPSQWLWPEHRRVWMEKALYLIPVLIMFGVNYWARMNHPEMESVVTLAKFGVAARLMQALWVWSWYLWKPWQPFDLAPKYPDLLTDLPFTSTHLTAAVLVVGISILVFLRRRVQPGLLAMWVCYVVLLVPLTGMTEHPHHTFDRYSYVAGGVWAVFIAGTVLWLLRRGRWQWQWPVMGAMALLCGIFGWLAQQQALVWSSSLALQTRMAESLGNHPQRAQHDVTAATLLLEANRTAEAAIMLRRALALRPELPEAWGAFGDVLADQSRLSEAIASYQRALRLDPELRSARQNFAVTLAMADRHEEAVTQFMELLRQNPENGPVHYNLALSLNRLGRKDEARLHLEEFRRRESRK